MTNIEASDTATQTAVGAEPGADVAPETASSTPDATQKKNAPKGRKSSKARDTMIADGVLPAPKAKKIAPKAKPPKAAEPKTKSKIAKVKATAKAAAPPKAKAAKAAKPAKAEKPAAEAREGSKKDLVLGLLRRKDGATMAEIAQATDWQHHTIRGFMSGNVGKRMGLAVQSSKNAAGERTYKVK